VYEISAYVLELPGTQYKITVAVHEQERSFKQRGFAQADGFLGAYMNCCDARHQVRQITTNRGTVAALISPVLDSTHKERRRPVIGRLSHGCGPASEQHGQDQEGSAESSRRGGAARRASDDDELVRLSTEKGTDAHATLSQLDSCHVSLVIETLGQDE